MGDPSPKPGVGCVAFDEVIERVTSAANSREHALTDGWLTCLYRDMPDVMAGIDHHFAERGISADDCLALECVNSVPGALALLTMLKQGYSLVLLPPMHRRHEKIGTALPTPTFCRYQVTPASSLDHEPAARLDRPETFLCILENEQYRRALEVESDAGPRLYLRTSGSLGTPKMAVHSHARLLGNALNCVQRFRLEGDDRIAIPVPIFHMYGLGAGFLPGTIVGASMDLQENSNILRYKERERQFNPNVAFLTPALCDMLLKGRRSARTYERVVTAGDRIKEDVFRAFESRFGRLLNLYGSTEMGAIAAADPDDPLDVRAVTAGKPMADVQMRVDEKGAASADGTQVGELYCKHAYGFAGYVDEHGDRMDQGAMTQPDWIKTGDLGRIWQDGYIEVLGRCDHSVNRSGHLVLFADIEKALETLQGTARVVVVAAGESKWGKRIVAFCVPGDGGATLSEAQVRKACFDILPRYAIPDDVLVISSLPTLPNGKVDRPALVEIASRGDDGEHAARPGDAQSG